MSAAASFSNSHCRPKRRTRIPVEPIHIAVVDDDADVRDSLGVLLETAGYTVSQFGAAIEFLDREGARTAASVVDVNMPGTGGLRLQEEMTRRGIYIPVIIVTGNGDTKDICWTASPRRWLSRSNRSKPMPKPSTPLGESNN